MYCKYCGEIIDDDSAFCKFCGKKLTNDKKIDDNIDMEQNDSKIEGKNEFGLDKFDIKFDVLDKTDDISNAKCVIKYDNNTDPNDMDYITLENNKEISKWLILEIKSDEILIIRKEILYFDNFSSIQTLRDSWGTDGTITRNAHDSWQFSNVRNHLNGKYFNGFSDNFKKKILDSNNGKIFVLSAEEYETYFGNINNIKNNRVISRFKEQVKDVWCRENRYEYDDHMDIISEDYYRKFITIDKTGLAKIQETTSADEKGIRPVMWIKI